MPLIWTDGERLYPSLVTEALRVAQGAQTYVVHAEPATGGIQSVRVGAYEVPTEPTGELNMHHTPPRSDRYISAADIFDNARLSELVPRIEGRIVLIGTSATGLFDIRKTALGFSVPGVEIHAQALEQIINGQFLLRHDWTRGLELLGLVVTGLIISATTLYSGARMALLFGAVVGGLIVFGAWDALSRYHVLIDPSFPLGGGMIVWFVATALRYLTADRERREIRGAFSRYVHPTVLKDIERNRRDVRLGGENCELTVMFTDVRNFSQLSERIEPEEVVTFLNTLLGRLGAEIANEAGVIDKFIGGSVMAFWNAAAPGGPHKPRLRGGPAHARGDAGDECIGRLWPARGGRARVRHRDRHRDQYRACLCGQCRVGRALQLFRHRRRGERGGAGGSGLQGCGLRSGSRGIHR
jgi:adenylate cyclase